MSRRNKRSIRPPGRSKNKQLEEIRDLLGRDADQPSYPERTPCNSLNCLPVVEYVLAFLCSRTVSHAEGELVMQLHLRHFCSFLKATEETRVLDAPKLEFQAVAHHQGARNQSHVPYQSKQVINSWCISAAPIRVFPMAEEIALRYMCLLVTTLRRIFTILRIHVRIIRTVMLGGGGAPL
ncbi:uncharacterized protein LOC119813640 isoform X2 [Arvicola amphibius]|uniref:uncharacterized protein LOC119813640 isoform X2 n=1 Tax=Arvicola amphibius TaxID=1047088 RepID=UPI0018E3C554|nr:uncharacterized protein LOC119813640 isoform X2 [Arvicola amphibius]